MKIWRGPGGEAPISGIYHIHTVKLSVCTCIHITSGLTFPIKFVFKTMIQSFCNNMSVIASLCSYTPGQRRHLGTQRYASNIYASFKRRRPQPYDYAVVYSSHPLYTRCSSFYLPKGQKAESTGRLQESNPHPRV